jgi:hypothetical protein
VSKSRTPPIKPAVFSNPYFKTLLWINSVVCVTCAAAMIWAASHEGADGDMPKAKARVFEICSYVFVSTSGAFVGLLCGRAAVPDPPQSPFGP